MLVEASSPQGKLATTLSRNTWQHIECAAHMQEATQQPTILLAADPLAAAAIHAEAWAGEPFLRDGEDPTVALAPGTARRRALDDATAEIEAGAKAPSQQWKVRYGLMLGLERVLADPEPHTAAGTPLRRHQIDALAGMLTELISAVQRDELANGNGHALAEDELLEEDEEEDDVLAVDAEHAEGEDEDADDEPLGPKEDPGAVRRYRFRHPTASGKTIAAAGFVEAARTLGVLILTHRRLLVTQFTNDLTTEGYAGRFTPAIEAGKEPLRKDPLTIQTYAWFARHVDSISREAYQLVICDEAHTALGEKTSAAIRSFPEPIYIGMTATEQLIAKQVSDVFPASVDDLPLQDAARRGLIAPLRCLRVSAGGRDQLRSDRRRRLRPGDPREDARPPGTESGSCEPLSRSLRQHAGHRLRSRRRPTPTTWRRSSAQPGSRPRRCRGERRRCAWPRRSRPTSAERSTS